MSRLISLQALIMHPFPPRRTVALLPGGCISFLDKVSPHGPVQRVHPSPPFRLGPSMTESFGYSFHWTTR